MATGTHPPAERDLSTQGTYDVAKRARDDSGGPEGVAHGTRIQPPVGQDLGTQSERATETTGVRRQREEGVARGTRVQPPSARDLRTQVTNDEQERGRRTITSAGGRRGHRHTRPTPR